MASSKPAPNSKPKPKPAPQKAPAKKTAKGKPAPGFEHRSARARYSKEG
ncbi:hypothetical protein ACTMTF_15075 [Nonomuraea sp. ZG12]|jgi:hypothetical protein